MVFIDKNRKKNLIFLLFILPFICGVVFFADPNVAHAGFWDTVGGFVKGAVNGVTSAVTSPFLWVINILLYAVFGLISILLLFAGVLMDWATNPANFLIVANNPGVYESWKFVRDILNLFFIVFFLFAAFATIFQVETYNYKKILLKLVIMALLVNFSFPISRFIIDISNVLFYGIFSMGGFNQSTSLSSTLFSGINIVSLVAPDTSWKEAITSASTLTTKLLFANIFLFVAAVTFMIIGALFVIRIAVLTVLIIFSPVGFVAGVFPGTKKFADEWWSALFNQSFFAPVMALMIVIALNVMKALNSGGVLKESVQKTMSRQTVDGDYSTFIIAGATMAVPLIILWIGMMSAKKFGAIGADAVVGMGEKVAKWGAAAQFKAGWAGAKWVGRKAESKLAKGKVTKYFSPTVLKEAFKARSEAQHHEDMLSIGMAKGQMHNELNSLVEGADAKARKIPLAGRFIPKLVHKDGTDYEFLEQNKQKTHYETQLKERGGGEITEDSARAFLKEAMKEHNSAKGLAAMTALSKINGLDNIAGDFAVDMGVRAKGSQINIVEDYNATMREMLDRLGIDKQSAMKHMHNFGENAKSKGDVSFGDLYAPNVDTGVWSAVGNQAETVGGNFKKMKAQTRQDIMHPRALFEQLQVGGDRSWGDMHPNGIAIAEVINSDDVNSSNRKRADLMTAIKSAYDGATNPATSANYPGFKVAFNTNEEFRNYVAKTMNVPPASLRYPIL